MIKLSTILFCFGKTLNKSGSVQKGKLCEEPFVSYISYILSEIAFLFNHTAAIFYLVIYYLFISSILIKHNKILF